MHHPTDRIALAGMRNIVWKKTHSKGQKLKAWKIGSPPTGGAGRMKLSCVVPASVIHI